MGRSNGLMSVTPTRTYLEVIIEFTSLQFRVSRISGNEANGLQKSSEWWPLPPRPTMGYFAHDIWPRSIGVLAPSPFMYC